MHLDHITIRTRDLPGTRAFLLTVFDELQERARPEAIHRIPGHWLYAGDKPIIHLIGARGYGTDTAAEAYDHVGIHLDDYKGFLVNLVSPGLTDTEAYAGMTSEARMAMLHNAAKSLPAGKVGCADDLAAGYLFAIDNPFVTGAVIDIDGGALIN